jgi:hypothetical protein
MEQNIKINQINLESNKKIVLSFHKDNLKPLEAFFKSDENLLKYAFITSDLKIQFLIKERLNRYYQENLTNYVTEEDCLKETGLIFLNYCKAHCEEYEIEKIENRSQMAVDFMKDFFIDVIMATDDKINSLVEDPECQVDLRRIFIQMKQTIVNKK